MVTKVIGRYLLFVSLFFSFSTLNADEVEKSAGMQVGAVTSSEQKKEVLDDLAKVVQPKSSGRSASYIKESTLKNQIEDSNKEERFKRAFNEIETLSYGYEDDKEFVKFEEEILKSQLNDTGTFLRNNPTDGLFENNKRQRITAIQEGVMLQYDATKEESKDKVLGFNNPIFFLSDGIDSFSYTNSLNICGLINAGSYSMDCLVYPTEDIKELPGLIRRGKKSDLFDTKGISADFLIVRDDVYSQYKKGRGVLASSPDLDLLMYLNGDYMIMFSHSMKNIFSFEQLSAVQKGKMIRVAFFNQQSRAVFERTIAKVFPNHIYRYQAINFSDASRVKEVICSPNDIDLFVYFGGVIPDQLDEAMQNCNSLINPVTLSDSTLEKITKNSDFFSIANIVGYFPATSVLNYLEIYIALENSYRKALEEGKFDKMAKVDPKQYVEKPQVLQSIVDPKLASQLESKRQRAEQLRKKREEERAKKLEEIRKKREEKRQEALKKAKEKAEKRQEALKKAKEKEEKRQEALKKAKEKEQEKKAKLNSRKMTKEELALVKEQEKVKAKEQEKAKREEAQKRNKEKDEAKNPQYCSFFGCLKNILGFSDTMTAVDKIEENYFLNKELVIKESSLKKIDGNTNNNKVVSNNVQQYNFKILQQPKRSPYLTANTAVKTFGIRYVLLSSRYTKRENVIGVFDSIIKDYFLVRNGILTPDMAKFNVSDVILGTTGGKVRGSYHPALARYPNYLLEIKGKKTPEQTLALRILNINSAEVNYPPFFGPDMPGTEQIDFLYTKARETNRKKEELALIRVYQRDAIAINKALSDMRSGKKIDDGILETTGLEYVDAIFDEQSVMDQGMTPEENLSPEANLEIQKQQEQKTQINSEVVTPTDVENSVDGKNSSNDKPSE